MSKFKSSVDFRLEALTAARNRVLDGTVNRGPDQTRKAVRSFLSNTLSALATPPVTPGIPWESKYEQYYLKQLKYFVNLHNLKANKIEDLVSKSVKENFASLREIQRELLSLLSETSEEETKLLGGYSQVHHNAFVRGIDAPLGWKDLSGLQDYKTGFAFRQKHLMQPLQNAGLSLPIRAHFEVPILDIYIVDEATDVGDTMHPIETSPPKNLIRKNKVFNHVVLRKEYDHTSRKFKSKTSYDQYPYNCISTMTIEIEMPSMVQLNYFNFEPIGGSTVYIPEDGLSYKSEDGSEVSLSTLTIPGEVSTTLIFQPIHTKYLRVKFEQHGTVGRKDMVIGDKKVMAFNDLLASTDMTLRYPSHDDRVKGRVYDFSLANVSVGLYAFEPKGIFRSSASLNVDSPIGFDLRWEAEQLIPFESFDTYLRSAILPEGRTLLESYLYAKLYGGTQASANVAPIYTGGKKRKRQDLLRDTLLVDSLVPVPDSYPVQVEYLDLVQDKGKAKLFPGVKIKDKSRVIDICLHRYELSMLSGDASTAAAVVLDKPPQVQTDYYNAIGLDPSSIATINILPEDLPDDRVFNSSIQEHVSAKALWQKAVMDMVALKRDNLLKDLTIVFTPPSDDDLAYMMGDLWHRATDDLKEIIRNNPEDFLLLSEGVLYGSSKKIENNPSSTVTLYCRTHLYSLDSNSVATPLGQALMNTKLLQLEIESFDGTGLGDVVSISMKAVRDRLQRTNPILSHLSSKDRALVERFSEINYYANEFRDVVITALTGMFPGQVNAWPNYVAAFEPEVDIQALINNAFLLFSTAVLRNTPTIEKTEVQVNILGGNSGGTGYSYKQSHGKKGASIFHPVRHAAENPTNLIDPDDVNIGATSTAGDISKSELLQTYHLHPWYYDYVASGIDIGMPGAATHERVSYRWQNWFTPRPPTSNIAGSTPMFVTGMIGTTDTVFNDSFLKDSTVVEVTPTGEITNDNAQMVVDSFGVLKALFTLRQVCWTWKFTTDSEHNLGVGDIVGFNTKPYNELDGQYYVVGVEKNAFYVKAFEESLGPIPSPIIESLAPGDCDGSADWQINLFSEDISNISNGAEGNEGCLTLSDANCLEQQCPEGYECNDGSVNLNLAGECVLDDNGEITGSGGGILNMFEPFASTVAGIWQNHGAVMNNIAALNLVKYDCEIQAAPNDHLSSLIRTYFAYGMTQLTEVLEGDYIDPAGGTFFSNATNIQACCNGIDLSDTSVLAFNAAFKAPPIELYENNCLLTIGEDYDISLNSGSDWLGTFPLDSSYEYFRRAAQAGNFLLRLRAPKSSSVYWLSYRVESNQGLSEAGHIYLKNGRVTCDKTIKGSSGKLDTIIIARTRTANPYLTPLLRNYSLRVQENQKGQKNSGKLEKKTINMVSKTSTINVS